MKRLSIACLLWMALCWLPAGAYAENCSGLPTHFTGNEFPTGNFFSNFDNACYLIPIPSGNGSGSEEGDLNSIYNKLFYTINPAIAPYELIILGQFPNARYFSIGLYDNHSAVTSNITDVNMLPLTASDINPFEPGVAFVSGQRYGAAIHLGGTPGVQETGCLMTGYNVENNSMDGTQRHPYMNWNLDSTFLGLGLYKFHEVDTPTHSNPNPAGVVLLRTYLDLTAPTQANQPHVIVRDVASGCAYPAAYVTGTMDVITTSTTVGNTWLNQQQVQEHNIYAAWQPSECWGTVYSALQWLRGDEYTPGANPDSSYLITDVPAGLPQTMATAGEVFLIQFRVPTTPPTPCVNGCSRSGSEQMRYTSISFQIPGGGTLASLPDSCPLNPITPCTPLVQDPNGYVSLVVGTGVPQPPQATAANGYTWLDLSKVGNPNYLELNEIDIRDILPSSWYDCAAQEVPYKVSQATQQDAGLMGLYSPVVTTTYTAATLPPTASPLTGPTTCGKFPSGIPAVSTQPQQCEVLAFPPLTISALTTQCSQQQIQSGGCNQVVVQPTPLISIVGNGFGSFPLGLPYIGNSNFVQIQDTTQNWSAGYTGNACTVSVGEWTDTLISLVANVNANGVCPMSAGDLLDVTVWNPQSLKYTTFPVTVSAPQGGAHKSSH